MAVPAAGIQSSGKFGVADTCPVANQTAPTQTVYLPNITKTLGGATGWVTPFIVQNTGTIGTTLEVSFYKFSDGSCVARRTVLLLAPGTSFVWTNAGVLSPVFFRSNSGSRTMEPRRYPSL